jgi:hypothetical protein
MIILLLIMIGIVAFVIMLNLEIGYTDCSSILCWANVEYLSPNNRNTIICIRLRLWVFKRYFQQFLSYISWKSVVFLDESEIPQQSYTIFFAYQKGPSWSWSYGHSSIYKHLSAITIIDNPNVSCDISMAPLSVWVQNINSLYF